jgi:hypothetical protein
MKNPLDISSKERIEILKLHLGEKKNYGTRIQEQNRNSGIKKENPPIVINSYEYDGKTTTITFNQNGTYTSNRALIGNTKSLQGKWRYVPKPGTGGRIYYSSGGINDGFIQELGYDLEMNDELQRLLYDQPNEYNKLPIMTKLINLKNSKIPTSQTSDVNKPMLSQTKQLGCPTGCVRDPNFQS